MPADEHLRQWLAEGMTGCQFAKLIAQRKDRIVTATFAGLAQEEDVSRVFDAGAQAQLPAIALFTGIRTEHALAEQLHILARGPRWTLTEEHPEGLTTDDIMVGMEWRIRDGLASSPMGLAPFATMPVTRRAPYVCIAAWPGGHDNPNWTRFERGIVHFLDTDLTALKLTKAKYPVPEPCAHVGRLALVELDHDPLRVPRISREWTERIVEEVGQLEVRRRCERCTLEKLCRDEALGANTPTSEASRMLAPSSGRRSRRPIT